ncbi:MAG TPA: beta-xylosidase [Vicinamibacteria bacterium]
MSARVAAVLLGLAAASPAATEGPPFPVTVRVEAGRPLGRLAPIWRFFGADEPNYATMKDGRKLLRALGELEPKAVYFRTHNLLNSGDGTPALKWGSTDVYTEDAQGRPVYDWKVVDRILDTYLERGVRPYVEIGFMPRALSTKPDPYQHEWRPGLPYGDIYTGWAYPPRDYSRWGELVYRWVRHCVERYGAAEVATWYWETWNEANIGYWQGTLEEFLRLHDHAIAAVRRALPGARVGGPDMAGSDPKYLRAFLRHCLAEGTPLDFIAFHAKGQPRYVDGHVQMGIAAHLATIDQGFATIASFPELRRTPIVIGESDPEGCAACQGPQLAYRNGTMYSSYTAASFARKHDLALRHGVNLEGALTWAFEFEDQAYFAGFRALATNGLPLPVLNVFRMFSKMDGQRVATASSAQVPLDTLLEEGVRGAPDVAALASAEPNRVAVMVWHYHDDDVPGPAAAVELAVAGLPAAIGEATLGHYRIDEHHGNSYAAWRRMGSPIAPDRDQYRELEAASGLALLDAPATARVEGGAVTLRFPLPRQAVSLVTIEWP